MIDTIEIVLHGVNEKIIDLNSPTGYVFKNSYNQMLYDRLCEYESRYITRVKDFVHETTLENPDGTNYKRKSIPKDYVRSRREGAVVDTHGSNTEIFFRPVKGDIATPSSDYRIQFWASENADAITLRFAIPKYLYNHNIAQFVPNYASERFKREPFSMREWSGQIKHIRQRIIEIIYTLFDDLSVMLNTESIANFDISNVEVKRLDLCYNQYHTSKENVLDYLNAQKKIFTSRVKKNTQTYDTMETSLYYRHSDDGFYFKIYHKGSEFLHADFPRLFKENESYFENRKFDLMPKAKEIFKQHFPETEKKLKGKTEDLIFKYYKTYLPSDENIGYCSAIDKLLKWKLKFLINESSKILRYEMSFTRTYLSTLYKREIFRKTDKNWKQLKRSHDLIKRYDLLLSQGKPEQAKIFLIKNRIDKQTRIEYEIVHRSLHKKHEFYLQTSKKIQTHESVFSDSFIISNKFKFASNSKNTMLELKEATLSDDLFKLLYKRFEEEIQFFQIKQPKETYSILEQIDLYNKKVEKRIENHIRVFGEDSFKKLTHTQKRKMDLSKFNKPSLKILLDKLEDGNSIDKICKDLGMSKSSYHSRLNDLKKFDIHKQTVKHKFDFRLLDTNFGAYYAKFLTEPNYARNMFHNPLLVDFDTIRSKYH